MSYIFCVCVCGGDDTFRSDITTCHPTNAIWLECNYSCNAKWYQMRTWTEQVVECNLIEPAANICYLHDTLYCRKCSYAFTRIWTSVTSYFWTIGFAAITADHQTQTRPSDCQMEIRDSSLQRTSLHCSRVHWWRSLCHCIWWFALGLVM